MKKHLKLGILCLLAGTMMMSCGKTEEKEGYSKKNDYRETAFNLDLQMVFVKGGTFTMGATAEQGSNYDSDERPTHEVTLSSYHIGKYPITQAQWKAVMGTNPSYFKGDDLPVGNIFQYQAKEFCDKLSAKTGKLYALPTEAQWEFAARGGIKSNGHKYSGSDNINEVAWFQDNSYDLGESHPDYGPQPVGTKLPNELGIYDMSGNVWERCADWYGDYSSRAVTNPTGPTSGSYHVIRGGSWNNAAFHSRVSARIDDDFVYVPVYNTMGFRVVCLP